MQKSLLVVICLIYVTGAMVDSDEFSLKSLKKQRLNKQLDDYIKEIKREKQITKMKNNVHENKRKYLKPSKPSYFQTKVQKTTDEQVNMMLKQRTFGTFERSNEKENLREAECNKYSENMKNYHGLCPKDDEFTDNGKHIETSSTESNIHRTKCKRKRKRLKDNNKRKDMVQFKTKTDTSKNNDDVDTKQKTVEHVDSNMREIQKKEIENAKLELALLKSKFKKHRYGFYFRKNLTVTTHEYAQKVNEEANTRTVQVNDTEFKMLNKTQGKK
uniref:Uncharacterized protein n=1 Tax=Cacopsylla melanoneura TaxID=428564 RepID=A0A8D8TP67_9HEMI